MYSKYINKYIFDLTSKFKNRINYISVLHIFLKIQVVTIYSILFVKRICSSNKTAYLSWS